MHPQPSRRQRGALLIELRIQKLMACQPQHGARMPTCSSPPSSYRTTARCSVRRLVGSAGNAPVRHFRLCFVTPDLQSGSRITSLGNWPAGRSSERERQCDIGPPSLYRATARSLHPALRFGRRLVAGVGVTPTAKLKGPEAFALPAHAISTKNKHLLLACATNPRFHGGCFGV